MLSGILREHPFCFDLNFPAVVVINIVGNCFREDFKGFHINRGIFRCPFVLLVGARKLVKRKAFEVYIEGRGAI